MSHPDPERLPQAPPVVAPLPAAADRPQWSVMIPVYNCAAFLPDALNGVLAQDPGPAQMQIEVVDDASTDADVAALVQALGRGRVGYYRQPRNVGSLRNFETCLNRSTGHLVHLLHGDDRVKPGFYEKMAELLNTYPEAGAAACHYATIDEAGRLFGVPARLAQADGLLDNWLLRLGERQRLQYVATVVRRSVYEELGSFYGTNYGEDWEMWVRIAKHYPFAYTLDILAEYRLHNQSISSTKLASGEIVADLVQVIGRIREHLPAAHRQRITKLASRFYAHYVITEAYETAERTQDWELVYRAIAKTLRLSRHLGIYNHLVRAWAKHLLTKYRKAS